MRPEGLQILSLPRLPIPPHPHNLKPDVRSNFAQLHHPVTMFGQQVLASHLPLAITGLGLMVAACYLWALEGPGGYHLHIDADGKVTESRGDHH